MYHSVLSEFRSSQQISRKSATFKREIDRLLTLDVSSM